MVKRSLLRARQRVRGHDRSYKGRVIHIKGYYRNVRTAQGERVRAGTKRLRERRKFVNAQDAVKGIKRVPESARSPNYILKSSDGFKKWLRDKLKRESRREPVKDTLMVKGRKIKRRLITTMNFEIRLVKFDDENNQISPEINVLPGHTGKLSGYRDFSESGRLCRPFTLYKAKIRAFSLIRLGYLVDISYGSYVVYDELTKALIVPYKPFNPLSV